MEPDTRTALLKMASHVAEQLVAAALTDMARWPVTITLHPVPPRKQLAPAPRTKRKYTRRAPKLPPPDRVDRLKAAGDRRQARPDKAWTPEQRRKFAATMAARRAARPAQTPAPSPATGSRVNAHRCNYQRCGHARTLHVDFEGACTAVGCPCTKFKE